MLYPGLFVRPGKGAGTQRLKGPSGNWFATPGCNRSRAAGLP